MKFYRFWAIGEATVRDAKRPWKVRAYGGSSIGMDDAQRRARDAAERIVEAIARGDRLKDGYGYTDRPVREEIIQEFRDGDTLTAAITRNSYGSLVLNTSRVMFVDVDLYSSDYELTGSRGLSFGEHLRELWDQLRGRPSGVKLEREARLLNRIQQTVQSRPGMGIHIYRTAAGYRLLVTTETFNPLTTETQQLLTAFGSDPLYTRLCNAQECFRARLSAKFWRCGANRPPSRFPWADAAKEAEYRRWEDEYHRLANEFATCHLVDHIGGGAVHPDVQPILELHDRLTIRDGATLA